MIKCDNAPILKFLTPHTLTSKLNNWGTDITSINHVTFEYIEGTGNVLGRYLGLYYTLDPEVEMKDLDISYTKKCSHFNGTKRVNRVNK